MLFCKTRFASKKTLVKTVAKGKVPVIVYQPLFTDSVPKDGVVDINGPHPKKAANWHVQAEIKNSQIIRIL